MSYQYSNQYNFDNIQQHPPPSSYMRGPTSKGRVPTAVRVTTSGGRPMTSVSGAGFPSTSTPARPYDSTKPGSRGPAPPLQKQIEKSPEQQHKELEAEVNKFIERSAVAKLSGKLSEALDLAKEAANKERQLRKQRELAGLLDQINIDLTYAVCFNLANMYQYNGMYQEALNTYAVIVRNKDYPQAGRLRVNMGNIYFTQKKYSSAVKMYRMALDLINPNFKHLRFQIMNNIGISFIKLGQYHDAIESFENIMQGEPSAQTAFNLILCLFAIGDKDKLKKAFTQLLTIEIPGTEEEEEVDESEKGPFANDSLSEYIKDKRRELFKYITDASKLIAPVIEADWVSGYDWVCEAIRASEYSLLESEIEIHRSMQFLKERDLQSAIEVFKSFEKKDKHLMARAATNISFLYFIEKDYKNAEKYADIAIKNDRYNAKALVNKGNCLFIKEEYEQAKEYFLEAIGVEADCVEAIYNLGLVNCKLDLQVEALQAFEKLQSIMSNAPEVMYRIALIYEQAENFPQAIKWYNILITKIHSDPGILLKIGQLYNKLKDENQAFHYYMESYRHYPVNQDAIIWLGKFYLGSELFEKACTFFERAVQIQPYDVRWKLLVASCYRRMGAENKALDLYEKIHEENPENIDCKLYHRSSVSSPDA